jgi:hypothetical protein
MQFRFNNGCFDMGRLVIIVLLISFVYTHSDGAKDYGFNRSGVRDTLGKGFIVHPSLNGHIIHSMTNVYCSSLQIAWTSLRENVFKGNILIDKRIPWVDFLNRDTTGNTLGKDFFSVKSGFGRDNVLQEFQKDLLTRFGYEYRPEIAISNYSIYSFSFIRKKLKFENQFLELMHENLKFNKKATVTYFGAYAGWPVNPNSARIHDYISEDDFILQLEVDGGLDEIYLAKIKPQVTLLETYHNVFERIAKNHLSLLSIKDEIKIPYLNFKVKNQFYDIKSTRILNKGYNGFIFDKVVQIIDFDLNESGISVESITEIDAVFGGPEQVVPRKLIFDKPFFIIMKEKISKNPYLLLWIGNDEFMRSK